MKRGGGVRRKYHLYELFSLAACCLCFFGCGLETIYALDEPMLLHSSTYSTVQFEEKYFEFETNEVKNSDPLINPPPFKFLGTDVYYKIYNRHESITSVTSALSSANNSTDPSSAAKLLTETYKYKQLGTSAGARTPLIQYEPPPSYPWPPYYNGHGRCVYIRLSSYQNDDYTAKFINNYTGDNSVTPTAVPRREGNRYSFDFGRDGDNDKASKTLFSTDTDYNYSSSGFSSGYDNTYFVDMYAVSVGRDENYTEHCSKVLHLGTVAINASSKDN